MPLDPKAPTFTSTYIRASTTSSSASETATATPPTRATTGDKRESLRPADKRIFSDDIVVTEDTSISTDNSGSDGSTTDTVRLDDTSIDSRLGPEDIHVHATSREVAHHPSLSSNTNFLNCKSSPESSRYTMSIPAPTPIWTSSASTRTLQASESAATVSGLAANADNTRVELDQMAIAPSTPSDDQNDAASTAYNLPWLEQSLAGSHMIVQSRSDRQQQAPSASTPTWSLSSGSRGPIDDDRVDLGSHAGQYDRDGYVSWARRNEIRTSASMLMRAPGGRTPSPLPPLPSPSPSPSDGTRRIWTADRRSWFCGDCNAQNGFQADVCGRCGKTAAAWTASSSPLTTGYDYPLQPSSASMLASPASSPSSYGGGSGVAPHGYFGNYQSDSSAAYQQRYGGGGWNGRSYMSSLQSTRPTRVDPEEVMIRIKDHVNAVMEVAERGFDLVEVLVGGDPLSCYERGMKGLVGIEAINPWKVLGFPIPEVKIDKNGLRPALGERKGDWNCSCGRENWAQRSVCSKCFPEVEPSLKFRVFDLILPIVQAVERDPRGLQLRQHRDVLVARADNYPPSSAIEDSYRGPRIGRQYVVDRQRSGYGGGRRNDSAPSSDDFLTVQQLRAIPAMQSRSYSSQASNSGSEVASTVGGYLDIATPNSMSSSAGGDGYFARHHKAGANVPPIGLEITNWDQQFDKDERHSLAKFVDFKHQDVMRRAQTLIGSSTVKQNLNSIWQPSQQNSPLSDSAASDPWRLAPAPIGSDRPRTTHSTPSPCPTDEATYGEMADVTQAIERLLKEKD